MYCALYSCITVEQWNNSSYNQYNYYYKSCTNVFSFEFFFTTRSALMRSLNYVKLALRKTWNIFCAIWNVNQWEFTNLGSGIVIYVILTYRSLADSFKWYMVIRYLPLFLCVCICRIWITFAYVDFSLTM